MGMLAGTVCVAQQAGSIDLTQIEPRQDLRRPPAREGEATGRRGMILSYGSSCPTIPKDAPSLQATLVWLDHDQYSQVDRPKFEARILNSGSVPIKIPFSPHLADFQPEDPGAKFSYWEMLVSLEITVVSRNVSWNVSGGGAALFGNDSHAGTMLTLQPGEWVQIIGQAQPVGEPLSNLPPAAHSAEAISDMNASVAIHRNDTLLTSTESATVQYPLCMQETAGQKIAVKLR